MPDDSAAPPRVIARAALPLADVRGARRRAQRALADIVASLQAEAAVGECIGRLRLAADMIGLGRDEAPWSEAKSQFFFWMLPLCVPPKRMKQYLNDVDTEGSN